MHVWRGYHAAVDEDRQAQHEVWLASMSPDERAAWEAEADAAYWAELADDAREAYEPREGLCAVVAVGDGPLLLTTSETDTRGTPGPG